ncbi:MAG: hypothetical protein WBC44_19835 [Planctomycetaceae bacterium]
MSRRTLLLGSVVVVGGLAIAWLSSNSAVAQLEGQGQAGGTIPPDAALGGPGGGGFGGGGFGGGLGGGGFGGGFVPQSFAGEQIIQGGGYEPDYPSHFILIAPDKIQAWGYSTAKGEWKQAPLDDKAETVVTPVLGTMVATITEGNKVHGFSSLKGEWSTLELPEGTKPEPVVYIDSAQVRTATSVSIFSARTGNWATVKFAEK